MNSQTHDESELLPGELIRTVAKLQKALLICILLYFIAIVAQFAVPEQTRVFVGIAALIPILTGTVAVFMLATRLYGTVLGIIFGLLTLIPIVGFLVLLTVNGKATRMLKQHNVPVGLLGADLSKL